MKKKEQKLTRKEAERKEEFEKVCDQMAQNGYIRHDLTVGIGFANIMAIVVMLPFVIVLGWIYHAANPGSSFLAEIISCSLFSRFAFLGIVLVLVVLHELIHGITWACFAENHFHSIDFGVIWRALTPYCTCSEPLRKTQYILGSVMPTLILGFGLAVVAIWIQHLLLFVAAEFMIVAGGADFLITLKILFRKTKGRAVVYYDHPYECGVVLFEKNAED